ncbi:YopX family protein [Streptococcus suis]|uniref:YopX family protein n=1 Tax=Streptococcus suis TaxID=1307 RepID=UPI003010514C
MIPKFRVWDKDDEHMYFVAEINLVEELISVDEYDYIFDFSDVVLMQSTGLFDVNGKEIFEGDVIKFNDVWAEYCYEGYVDGTSEGENFTEIIKTEDGFSFGRTKIQESSLFDFLSDEHMKFSEIVKSDDFNMVVVGNIYENPELMEG